MKKGYLTKSKLQGVQTYQGQSLERMIEEAVTQNTPIEKASPIIYTEKKEGVVADYDIRTDRWAIAQQAREKITASRIAKRNEAMKEALSPEEPEKEGEQKSGDPSQSTNDN